MKKILEDLRDYAQGQADQFRTQQTCSEFNPALEHYWRGRAEGFEAMAKQIQSAIESRPF
jgi:hypothetical protein